MSLVSAVVTLQHDSETNVVPVIVDFDHSYNRASLPSPFILGSTINERQVASKYRTRHCRWRALTLV